MFTGIIIVAQRKRRRDCLFADKEIAFLRALSTFLKETYRQNMGPEKCAFDADRGRGVKEIHLSADRVHCTRIGTFYGCTRIDIITVRREI